MRKNKAAWFQLVLHGGFFWVCVLTLAVSQAQAAEKWQRTFGGTDNDYGNSIQQTIDGGYIVVGRTYSHGKENVYLVKLNAYGDKLWQKTFGLYSDWGKCVQQTKDGGFIIVGSSFDFSFESYSVYLIKTNAQGDQLWSSYFHRGNRADGNSVQETKGGGYIMVGGTFSSGSSDQDVYLIKTNAHGDRLWHKTFGGKGKDWGTSVLQTTDGGYILTGVTSSFGSGGEDVYLIKTNALGEKLWQKTFGGTHNDRGNCVRQTKDGGYIITGSTLSYGEGVCNVYLIKTDANGNKLWQKALGGAGEDWGNSVQQTSDGGYIIAGGTYSFGTGKSDVYLLKTDSKGSKLWETNFGGPKLDRANSVQQTTDGGYIVAGSTQSYSAGGNDFDVYLIKTDAHGRTTKMDE